MPRRPRSLAQRIRDQIGFSLVTLLVVFMLLKLVGLKATIPGFVLSLVITIGLNVALSYYADHKASRPVPPPRGGGDIRWRDDDARR
ncbi:hypothetical protein [Brachybacterium hainanense]|uniref:Permease n=1 Tax=Brachybacterium hainanense TaxID=1541174 RepID=A0ABV6RIW6_9MICO